MNLIQNINSILSDSYKNRPKYQGLLKDEFNTLLNTKFSQASEAADIYRGMADVGQYVLMYPCKRVSQNTTNVYTRLMSDILPSWKDYPKRSESFICSTSEITARGYNRGNVYQLFPSNNTLIGVCSSLDIWESFDNNFTLNMDYFNDFIIRFFTKIDIYKKFQKTINIKGIFNVGSKKSILNLFDYFDKLINYNFDDLKYLPYVNENSFEFYFTFLENCAKYGIVNYLDILLNPKTNGFKLVNISDFKDFNTNKEVWFSSPCLGKSICN